jgi:hypothetical protein
MDRCPLPQRLIGVISILSRPTSGTLDDRLFYPRSSSESNAVRFLSRGTYEREEHQAQVFPVPLPHADLRTPRHPSNPFFFPGLLQG